MRVLFLDDSPHRTEEFRREVPGAVTVATAAECIALLGGGAGRSDGTPPPAAPWDAVFLDHDLGGEVFVESERPDTGMEVVRWVEKHHPAVRRFVVHTHNEGAGREMRERLEAAGYPAVYRPFGWFDPAELLRRPKGRT